VKRLTSVETKQWFNHEESLRICRRWVAMCGMGFHPDTRGADYSPALPKRMAAKYDQDMERLFALGGDPYAFAVQAMEERFERR
jgi:hypothetical protein